jgi:RNA polymerase sigma-70 factor, ECF subfamily
MTTPTPNLEADARRAARGDAPAFERVCRALQGDVWRYCRAVLGDDEPALEAAQDTFLRATTAIRRYRGEGEVRIWMMVLARRACAAVVRQQVRDRALLDGAPLHDAPAPSAAHSRVEFATLLAALPFDQRQAFVLTQALGLSYAEAAQVAEVAVGTIRSRVFRARERLVEAWVEGGGQTRRGQGGSGHG